MLGLTVAPSPALNVTAYVVAAQCAYSVCAFVIVTFVSAVICVPFSGAVYHPANAYPALIGVGNVPYVELYVTSFVLGLTVAPSPALNVTAYVVAAQCAYSVCAFVIVTFVSAVICVPFSGAVYHPANAYPALIGVGNVPYVELYVTSFVLGLTVAPSPALNVTVYVAILTSVSFTTTFPGV